MLIFSHYSGGDLYRGTELSSPSLAPAEVQQQRFSQNTERLFFLRTADIRQMVDCFFVLLLGLTVQALPEEAVALFQPLVEQYQPGEDHY